jgi:hypothetical protein
MVRVPEDDAGFSVDNEIFPILAPGVCLYRFAVGMFGHILGDQRNGKFMQAVCQPVN